MKTLSKIFYFFLSLFFNSLVFVKLIDRWYWSGYKLEGSDKTFLKLSIEFKAKNFGNK